MQGVRRSYGGVDKEVGVGPGAPMKVAPRAVAVAVGLVALSLAAGCQTGPAAANTPAHAATPAVSSATPVPPVELTITPADKATNVPLTSSVAIQAIDGTIARVEVKDPSGAMINGSLDATAHSWRSADQLVPSTSYLVTAEAVDAAGHLKSLSSAFTTTAPAKVLGARIAPLEGEVVGVGMPIVVYFTAAVTDKAAVERKLSVDMSEQVLGSWHWYGSKEVHFRPSTYWPPGEVVTLHADLKGVNAGNGVWGLENRTLNFSVGDSHVTTVDAKSHTMAVAVNGKTVRTALVSTGRDKYPTTSGVHVVLEKTPTITMDSATVGIPKGNPDYYYETVLWDVRISWSGEFVHSAPWSVGSQGHTNVSHGCVNASPADAQWFYHLSRRGDIVVVTNTGRPLISGNGWTDWNMDWAHWIAGSALQGTGNGTGAVGTGSGSTTNSNASKPATPTKSPSASKSTATAIATQRPSQSASRSPSATPTSAPASPVVSPTS
jgi:lipoprotein-anchoring transpeptidase ErfK/SrfK